MRYLFRTRYQQDIALWRHSGDFFWYGLLGFLVLFAMWFCHARLFLTHGGLSAWIGAVVVIQNITSSLFNSHLFDFAEGWLYVVGVGVAGGAILRHVPAPPGRVVQPSKEVPQS